MGKQYISLSIFFLIGLLPKWIWAQCPTNQFTLPDTVCVNQSFTIPNTSSGASSYNWDFCSGDLRGAPTVSNVGPISGAGLPLGVTVVQDGANWYGFVTSRGSGELYRFDLGTNPTTATPTMVNLGNPDGVFNTPDKIRLIKEGNNWYGLVANDTGHGLVRLSFGPSLATVPTAVDLGNLGILNRPRGVELVRDKGQTIAVITNLGDNTLQLINFGSSIANSPVSTLSTPTLSGASALVGISVVKDCDRWVGVVVSVGSNRLYKLDFGSNIFSQPLITDITNGYGYATPVDLQLVQDGGEYVGLLCSDAGSLYRLSFGSSIASTFLPKVSNLGSFGGVLNNTGTVAVIKEGSQWSFWTINSSSNQLFRGLFPSNCSASQAGSTAVSPTLSYSSAGKYYIDLTAYDANGNSRTMTDSLVVASPSNIDFTTTGQCIGVETKFFGPSQDIVSWAWDFGDNTNPNAKSNVQNPVYQFPSTGSYQVSLTAKDKRGCSVSIIKTIGIGNKKPTPDFNNLLLFCPDNTVQFTDASVPFIGETISKWQWTFGDPQNPDAVVFQRNPQYTYPQAGSYEVSLTIFGSSGCDATIKKTVIIDAQVGAQFTLPDTVCVNQSFTIPNTSSGASSYNWDFCSGDLRGAPTVSNVGPISGAGLPLGVTVVQDGANWYGFVTSRGSGELYRFDLGTNPTTATPTMVNLGNPDGVFNTPDKIRLIKEGNNWYGLVANDTGHGLVRLSFGPSLATVPTAVDLGNLGILNRPRGVELVRDKGQTIAVITNLGDNTLQLINFGSSIANSPVSTLSTPTLSGASALVGISVVKDCDRWVGVVVSVGSNRLYKLDFGSNIFSQPLITDITNGYGYATPVDLQLVQDGGEYVGLLCSDAGSLYRLSFGSSIASTFLPKVSNLGSFGGVLNNTGTVAVIKEGSQWSFWTINSSSNQLFRGLFPSNCSASQAGSTAVSPTLSYSSAGKYYIDLTAYDANGNSRTMTDSVLVKNTVAPAVSFTTDNQCTQLATIFFGPTQDVATWQWDFGDTNLPSGSVENISTLQDPTHQYAKEGTYQVVLTVQSGNGCRNRIAQPVIIYNNQKPKPAFVFPAQVCSFSELQFTDQSIPATGDIVRNWRWDFGDGQTSASQNPVHMYTKGGNYSVSLSVSGISGCDTTITQSVNILPGANTNFSYTNVCIGDTVQFTNLTSPEGTWLWGFGDPASAVNTSTEKNPRHYYAAAGTYTVQLNATTANGCVVSRQQQIKIRRLPTVDFIASKLCANNPVTFTVSALDTDTTTAIIEWDFGDPGSPDNLSTAESPVHTFTKGGSYTVRLAITTSAGCQGSVSHLIDISEPSKPGFMVSESCAGLPMSFTDSSVAAPNDALNRWTWNFGDNSPVVTVRNPVHTFSIPGTYNVKLMIEGSQSDCQNAITKSVTVFPQPQVSFGTTPSCRDYSVRFTDNSTVANDRIQSWEWNFGGEGTSTESNPIFNFNRTGTFAVSLKVTTANGCSASTSKTVTVDLLPEADFRFSPDFQAPPIEVKFTNDSRRAINYEWDFGDGSPISTEVAPRHTYQEIGTYSVRLLAFGSSGCADTLIKTVSVAIVIVDARVKGVIANQANGLTTAYAEVVNAGTVPLASLELVLQSGTAVDIQEKWTGNLNPKQSLVYPFKAQLLRSTLDEFPYLCVTVRNPNSQEDAHPSDNRSCTSSLDGIKVLPVYPNPASTQITVPFILPEAAPVALLLYDAQGQRVRAWQAADTQTGYNELKMDTGELTGGLYLVQLIYQGRVYGQKVVKR